MNGAQGDMADSSKNAPAAVDAAQFDGLLEHVEKHLGATYAFDPPEGRGYGITMHRLEDAMVSAVTTGLRFQDLAARPPMEFVCSLRQDQERGSPSGGARGRLGPRSTGRIPWFR